MPLLPSFLRARRTAPAGPVPPGPVLSAEALVLATSLFWAVAANRLFLGAALRGRDGGDPQTWLFVGALIAALVCLHYLLLAPFAWRRATRPLLALMVVVTALASYFMQAYGVYLDPGMIRNAVRTDLAESRELLSAALLGHLLLYAGPPLVVLWHVRPSRRPWRRALAWRIGTMLMALALLLGAVWAVFQPLASLMRSQRELRYLVTPANLLWSTGVVAADGLRGAARPRQPIGLDAAPGPRMAARQRPLVVVMVVGETARAANWGLSGYPRQTTPQLARLPVTNFAQVTSCGTNTEVSLPCMFAPVGRRDYDEARIRGSESLLHVAARAGVQVHWRDNQSGCKGVRDGLPQDAVKDLAPPGLCSEGRCLDEGLLAGLPERLEAARGTQLLVLHMLGNHGPSYFRRYPPSMAQFQPACDQDDLRLCSRESIVNAYDNALLYTDAVLARLVQVLQAADGVDSVLVFASDHGESLGENNFYLHGLPYPIAPDVQTRIPMLMWTSPGLARTPDAVDGACLARRAAQPASHDHLFHTLLGLLDVKTTLYEPAWDLTSGCRAP